jgi:hypothetical protein
MSASFAAASRTRPSLDRLDPAEAEEWERRLRATAHPCGCKSGAVASLVALFCWPLFVIVSSDLPRSFVGALGAVVVYGVVVIGAGVAGKVAGILVGRSKHRRVRQRLVHRLALVTDQER